MGNKKYKISKPIHIREISLNKSHTLCGLRDAPNNNILDDYESATCGDCKKKYEDYRDYFTEAWKDFFNQYKKKERRRIDEAVLRERYLCNKKFDVVMLIFALLGLVFVSALLYQAIGIL